MSCHNAFQEPINHSLHFEPSAGRIKKLSLKLINNQKHFSKSYKFLTTPNKNWKKNYKLSRSTSQNGGKKNDSIFGLWKRGWSLSKGAYTYLSAWKWGLWLVQSIHFPCHDDVILHPPLNKITVDETLFQCQTTIITKLSDKSEKWQFSYI